MGSRLASQLLKPVDIASLVVFRILFGAIMIWEVCRYFDHGWISDYYIKPTFFFTYYGFSWVRPWPGNWMYVHFVGLGVLALFIAIGLFYRVSALLFFLGFTYVFLLDQTNYLNHFYFVSLVSFLMIFVPAHRWASVDAWRKPENQSQIAPAWSLWILRAQLAVIYIGAGVAKINADFLQGEPMRMWLSERSHYEVIGPLFTKEWAVWFFSLGGLFFDLFIVPALLWRRTRPLAFVAVTFFHLMNAYLFRIGIFPWIALGATIVLFLPPDWPRRYVRSWAGKSPILETTTADTSPARKSLVTALVCLYLLIQILVPLRHLLYPGNVSWTEEGHRFSWHMKLRDKEARGDFWIVDPKSSEVMRVKLERHLSRRQYNRVMKMPDMILQFAHYMAERVKRELHRDLEVRATIKVSLNGRPPQTFIDPEVNLAAMPRTLGHASWIMPLETPFAQTAREGE